MTGGRVDESVVSRVRTRLATAGEGAGPAHVAAALAGAGQASGAPWGATGVLSKVASVRAELTGAGPLQPLLDDPDTTDVLVNGPGEVWVDRGDGLLRLDLDVGGEVGLRALAVRLAAVSGRRLDDGSPCVDVRLADGVRLHAVLPPVSPTGTHLSLRVPRRRTFSLDDLVACGTVPPAWAPVLTAIVRRRLGFLVCGGTGSGKTTVLSTLLGLADPSDRVVLVEDTGELTPALPHVVHLEARHANAEGAGSLTLADLVREALRMRPDRLVVGECRGAEVSDLLAALNTGHEGGCGTVHANTAGDVPARLEALASLAGMDRTATASQVASALDVVVHLARTAGRRRVQEVAVVMADRSSGTPSVRVETALSCVDGRERTGPGWDRLACLLDRGRPPRDQGAGTEVGDP